MSIEFVVSTVLTIPGAIYYTVFLFERRKKK